MLLPPSKPPHPHLCERPLHQAARPTGDQHAFAAACRCAAVVLLLQPAAAAELLLGVKAEHAGAAGSGCCCCRDVACTYWDPLGCHGLPGPSRRVQQCCAHVCWQGCGCVEC